MDRSRKHYPFFLKRQAAYQDGRAGAFRDPHNDRTYYRIDLDDHNQTKVLRRPARVGEPAILEGTFSHINDLRDFFKSILLSKTQAPGGWMEPIMFDVNQSERLEEREEQARQRREREQRAQGRGYMRTHLLDECVHELKTRLNMLEQIFTEVIR